MAIASGIQTDLSTFRLEPGQLLEFEYNGTMRWGIVITPLWKGNCDCYVFESLDDVPQEVLEWGLDERADGEAYATFSNQYTFKSFKVDDMTNVCWHYPLPEDTYTEEEGHGQTLPPQTLFLEGGG